MLAWDVPWCTWNDMIFELEVPQKATQYNTGTYCRMASNQLDSYQQVSLSTILFIIIVALGISVITIRWKLPYRQEEKNKEEESQLTAQQAEKCNTNNC
ncbi:unnamed protein product [Nyctereutes procyonoides]|uniref:(raccoon dog) hypothetical protein n=1 Tax=Nyctereutes procyonoides TaxID=34880 RepID=A0A811Z4T2_NYCPR|nr:unnamed protein product [Nyctereutes procyonoides]